MKNKKICIPGASMGENSWGVTKPYLEYFSQFGQVEILTPREGIVDCDLLVLPGGADLSSIEYGKVPGFMNSNPDLYKEYFFRQNLKQYVDAKTPILGICLGMQQLNVFFGGSLTQNLLFHPFYSRSRDELVHDVYPVTGYNAAQEKWTFSRKKEDVFKVNSMHHQGVYLNQLADDLSPLLFSEGQNANEQYLVEAFRHNELPIMGIQYHAEETYCPFAEQLINSLLETNEEKVRLT